MSNRLALWLIVILVFAVGCSGQATTTIPTLAPTIEATEPSTAEAVDTAAVTDDAAAGLPISLGDPVAGQEHFNRLRNEVGYACATCHRVNSEAPLIGPGLLGIATRAAERVAGESAEEYLYLAIVQPDAYVVAGFPNNLMPETYADVWSAEELGDLVAYLLNLE
jgi:cytochrome c2